MCTPRFNRFTNFQAQVVALLTSEDQLSVVIIIELIHDICKSPMANNDEQSKQAKRHVLIIIIYPLTARVIGEPQTISDACQTPGLSIPGCCRPTFSSVCLVFFPLSLCLAKCFLLDLMNGKHDHITAVCVSLQWSGGLRVVRLPAGSWHGLLVGNMVFV